MKTLDKLIPIPLKKLGADPLVSVLMANYNYAEFIGEAIESVINQTYGNWELIICDDGSTDNTVEAIERYCKQDKRIKLICKENGGQASALNLAYENSNGEVIAILDSDDTFYSTKLARVILSLQRNNGAGFCTHKVIPVDVHNKQIGVVTPKTLSSGYILSEAIMKGGRTNIPPASALSFRREVLDLIFPIPLEFNLNADGIISELAQFITVISCINEPLSRYRLHSLNTGNVLFDYPNEEAIIKGDLRIPLFVSTNKQFLLKTFGNDIADLYDFKRRSDYIETRLALYLLRSKPKDGIEGQTFDQLISQIENKYRRFIWKTLKLMPDRIGVRLLKLWWSPSPYKKYFSVLSKRISY